jgi:hypothetical protein
MNNQCNDVLREKYISGRFAVETKIHRTIEDKVRSEFFSGGAINVLFFFLLNHLIEWSALFLKFQFGILLKYRYRYGRTLVYTMQTYKVS